MAPYWRAIFEDHNSMTKPPFPSAPLELARIRLTHAVLTASRTVYTQAAADPDLYLYELVLWLALCQDIIISDPALQQYLTEAGLTREILISHSGRMKYYCSNDRGVRSRVITFSQTGHNLYSSMKPARMNLRM